MTVSEERQRKPVLPLGMSAPDLVRLMPGECHPVNHDCGGFLFQSPPFIFHIIFLYMRCYIKDNL